MLYDLSMHPLAAVHASEQLQERQHSYQGISNRFPNSVNISSVLPSALNNHALKFHSPSSPTAHAQASHLWNTLTPLSPSQPEHSMSLPSPPD
jgi:hypothetical protein